jgi:gliding motility-associated-like protein
MWANDGLMAQAAHHKWFFGYGASLDFSTGVPQPMVGSVMNTDEGCASIADANGDLLFYTDGATVFNRNHQLMVNGAGLHGHVSSTQSSLIVAAPGEDSLYYIFTTPAQLLGPYKGLSYSMVNMRAQAGLGEVILKNIPLCDSVTEKLTATRASNGTDVWVVAHQWNSDAFCAFRVTCGDTGATVVLPAVISRVGSVHGYDGAINPTGTALGCMKISPDGRRLGLVWSRYRNDTSPDSDGSVEWLAFDPNTGIVSSPARLDIADLRTYGCAFSPSSRYLYVTTYGSPIGIAYSDIRQYDLLAPDVEASGIVVTTGNPEFGSLQLGPDGQLFVARLSFWPYISVIQDPDLAGLNCNFFNIGANLGTGMSTWGLPNLWDHVRVPDVFGFQDTSVCAWESVTVSAIILGAIGWQWSDGSSGSSATFATEGLHSVEVYLRCDTLRDTFDLRHQYCDPPFLPGRNAEICAGDGLHLDVTQPQATGYLWQYGQTTPAIFTADTGWIWVDLYFPSDTVRDSIYLSHRDCECMVLENVFSPNGDGANDEFQPQVLCELESAQFAIFDRWGHRIFTSSLPLTGWNGQIAGNAAPESVYYFTLEWKQYNRPIEQAKGSLLLIR